MQLFPGRYQRGDRAEGQGRAASPMPAADSRHTGSSKAQTPGFDIRGVYMEAKSTVKGASFMNKATTDKLRELFPHEVAASADMRRIPDAVHKSGLPQGTALLVQQISDELGVFSVEGDLISAENAGAVDEDVADREEEAKVAVFSARRIKEEWRYKWGREEAWVCVGLYTPRVAKRPHQNSDTPRD